MLPRRGFTPRAALRMRKTRSEDANDEGLALPPLPFQGRDMRVFGRSPQEATSPRCEMCGNSVVATHSKRICLKCGFMTGCSEGI